jgi:hypothetical protein
MLCSAVELNDEEDENPEISGDGLGDEDEFNMEGDEVDDERDPGEEYAGIQDTAVPRPRCPMPLWLHDAFKMKVTESAQRNEKGLPPLYANHQTFWFPRSSTFNRRVSHRKIFITPGSHCGILSPSVPMAFLAQIVVLGFADSVIYLALAAVLI